MEDNIRQVYNLEFPHKIEEFKIGDYIFKKIENYEEAYNRMMHLYTSAGGEYSFERQTGSHQITATVEIPSVEKKYALPWSDTEPPQLTQLHDILLLLTIFTGREIFVLEEGVGENPVIVSDHRIHSFGGQLSSSRVFQYGWRHKDTGEVVTEDKIEHENYFNYEQFDIGFEKGLNEVLDLITNLEWRSSYLNGYFLFLYRDAVLRQPLEKSFLTCWTIWEHLFSIKNRAWLKESDIFRISSDKKIAYILTKYFHKTIDKAAWEGINKLTLCRNRLVHFGKRKEGIEGNELVLFIRITEQLVATILGLKPSDVFNSLSNLSKFLKGEDIKNQS